MGQRTSTLENILESKKHKAEQSWDKSVCIKLRNGETHPTSLQTLEFIFFTFDEEFASISLFLLI